ncbi:hypothetical protein NP233_g2881 [Leucocoprinus birnbaumii]|uniref:Uncharacterized protein n=1 Tax=Leucocoprinus birnbaumii TaxID=56174 RepID=A0AAD5W0J8_9AGAR|nr:hypothetical protein NP233_g2881 [Leucocoprinus birnbaumii]
MGKQTGQRQKELCQAFRDILESDLILNQVKGLIHEDFFMEGISDQVEKLLKDAASHSPLAKGDTLKSFILQAYQQDLSEVAHKEYKKAHM